MKGDFRELLLLRHGKSDWRHPLSDIERPLKKRGRQGAQRIGAWLQQAELWPDLILCSPADRARQTAELCCKVLGNPGRGIQIDRELYLADADALLRVLARVPDECRRVLLVGHNPGLETLLRELASTAPTVPADGKLLATATLAQLSLPGASWRALPKGRGELVALVRASALAHRFPFPHAGERQEWRPRPAYYYHQAAAIPYRFQDGRLEVLLTGCRKGERWRLPQGKVEPGCSEMATACRQARVQGGVVGEVNLPCLGYFRREKWGADCDVAVYGVEVHQVLDGDNWIAADRAREWLAATPASQWVQPPEVGRLISKLARVLAG
ncbi:histidine phosphatase family protein [Marinobacter sp. SS21]|uniref:histidine phosphatase family protein n=1 Tax=Marinobacter sp. SS21 TaxID=2979460 RepID=UPI00232BA28E|nr:histidine phosphatase family protein [Marinobacter sp. SS21]MDC0662212.1 histidine phosphatase family protein [Marinobacter sp. SS21]